MGDKFALQWKLAFKFVHCIASDLVNNGSGCASIEQLLVRIFPTPCEAIPIHRWLEEHKKLDQYLYF